MFQDYYIARIDALNTGDPDKIDDFFADGSPAEKDVKSFINDQHNKNVTQKKTIDPRLFDYKFDSNYTTCKCTGYIITTVKNPGEDEFNEGQVNDYEFRKEGGSWKLYDLKTHEVN